MGGGQKVLVAIDGSDASEKALKFYLAHLYQSGDTVILGHVIEEAIEPSFGFRAGLAIPQEQWKAMMDEQENRITKLKEKFSKILEDHHVSGCKFQREMGKAGHHLVEMAEKEHVDLIVMGTRGLGTVRRTILGSVSDYIIHHAHTQVCVCTL